MNTYYFYSPETGEFLRAVTAEFEAFPAHTTDVQPPSAAGHRAVWDGSSWTMVPDFRGRHAYGPSGTVKITDLGPLPEGYSFTPPTPPPRDTALDDLAELDRQSVRPLRAIAAGEGTEADVEKLRSLEDQARTIRESRLSAQ